MPHAIYLHSALARDRHGHIKPGPRLQRLLKVTRWDVVVALIIAGGVNIGMLLLAIINLWSWRQPLLWAAIVTVGVLLSALVRWLILLLTLPGALLVLCMAAVAITVAIRKYVQRKRKDGSTA